MLFRAGFPSASDDTSFASSTPQDVTASLLPLWRSAPFAPQKPVSVFAAFPTPCERLGSGRASSPKHLGFRLEERRPCKARTLSPEPRSEMPGFNDLEKKHTSALQGHKDSRGVAGAAAGLSPKYRRGMSLNVQADSCTSRGLPANRAVALSGSGDTVYYIAEIVPRQIQWD